MHFRQLKVRKLDCGFLICKNILHLFYFLKLALAISHIVDTDRPQSSRPALILFWAPIQVLESWNGSGELQNLGQGLRVFKCTIVALTQGQREFTKMVCRLLKHLKKEENPANLYEQGNLCFEPGCRFFGSTKHPRTDMTENHTT